jgi:hypothetical protein
MSRIVEGNWSLLGNFQDSYSGQNAQDPRTSRLIKSFLPQDDGQLHRELPEPLYASNTVSGPMVGIYEFDQNDGHGHVNRFYFCAARTNSTVGTKNCNLYQLVTGAWSAVSTVGTLADAPMCVTQENNFHLADGVSNWLFNGTTWVNSGINFPLNPPAISVAGGTPQVYFDYSGVTLQFFQTNPFSSQVPVNGLVPNFKGAVSLTYPAAAYAMATVTSTTTASLLFNPTGDVINTLQWATLNPANGSITGYTTPWSGATTFYQMTVSCKLIIPTQGDYTIAFNHDDGAFFGFGNGAVSGFAPSLGSGNRTNVFQTQMPINSSISPMAGTNKSGSWQETVVVHFPTADTYPLEIAYCNWENEQTLTFTISKNDQNGVGGLANPNPYSNVNSNPGLINAGVGRYYWFTNADQTNGVATESSSSPIGTISGPLTGGAVKVYQQPGLFTASTGSTTVTCFNSTDNPGPVSPDLNGTMAGRSLYINGALAGTIGSVGSGTTLTLTQVSAPVQTTLASGATVLLATYTGTITGGKNNGLAGTIQTITGFTNSANNLSNAVVYSSTATTLVIQNASSVAETHAATATSPANSLSLVSNSLVTVATNGRGVICDPRCTHWNVYASESDGSKIGQYLYSVPVGQNLSTTAFSDTSPFLDNPANTFLPINRPVRNDPPFGSKLLTVHKTRQFRRQETSPNFFAFTANEEVTSGNNGDPAQCLPGSSINTVSDMVNVVSYPDQSARLRGLVSHLDSLYLFSEKSCFPLYGDSVDNFAISQSVAFALGLAGRFAAKSTTNGLVFLSYDRRAFLYPTSLYSSYLAQGGAAASALVEIGKPIRNVLATIPASRLDEVVSEWYHVGIRDWWVLSFPTSATSDAPRTFVYDFAGRGWVELQRGFSSLAMLEVSEGALVLVGGGVDGNSWVIDDQTGTYSTTGTLPAATWRPALIDFGAPNISHTFRRLELEFDSAALAQAIQITAWLDPLNVDSPGTGRALHLKPALGANRYSAFLTDQGGAVCKRLLLQIFAPSNTVSGVIRGIELFADSVSGFIGGGNRVGGV